MMMSQDNNKWFYKNNYKNEWLYKNEQEKENKKLIRKDCEVTKKVLEYLELEWGVNLCEMPIKVQTQAMDFLDYLVEQGQNVPNIAAKILFNLPPL